MAIDPITVEVVRAALNAAAERMRLTMIKTAYNHIISESLDFGCAIFDADVQMIAQGIGLPVFQGHLGFPIEATIRDRGVEAFRPNHGVQARLPATAARQLPATLDAQRSVPKPGISCSSRKSIL